MKLAIFRFFFYFSA
ncbi:pheST operon leader peptide PheM [Xenorhabdus anantnagensis]|uniref:pheST attenuator peptide n=1 Tax=Xenorhabdus anantnagensis TaxID=3025875 RepID=A0ABT5LM52_9GAMM|nr:pheST operon leader peptide PheM [Xenorhabdus anantnagensis]MDC9595496.1 pheST operon leader peptide PheM [Xenorhabdus anantnagensis]